jgi:hypothetical protein
MMTSSLNKRSMTMVISTLLLATQVAAFSGVSTTTRCAVNHAIANRLQYQSKNGESASANLAQDENDIKSHWWNRFGPSHKVEVDETSQKVDEYLEFLDRRYQRLHETESAPAPSAKFSALKWLKQGEEHTASDHENALYALGIAGLASERLLQRKKVHVVKSESSSASSSSAALTAALSKTAAGNSVNGGTRLSMIFANKRAVESSTLKAGVLFAALMRWAATTSNKTARAIWRHGGGRKTIAATATALVALVVVVSHPLSPVLLREGVNVAVLR